MTGVYPLTNHAVISPRIKMISTLSDNVLFIDITLGIRDLWEEHKKGLHFS